MSFWFHCMTLALLIALQEGYVYQTHSAHPDPAAYFGAASLCRTPVWAAGSTALQLHPQQCLGHSNAENQLLTWTDRYTIP